MARGGALGAKRHTRSARNGRCSPIGGAIVGACPHISQGGCGAETETPTLPPHQATHRVCLRQRRSRFSVESRMPPQCGVVVCVLLLQRCAACILTRHGKVACMGIRGSAARSCASASDGAGQCAALRVTRSSRVTSASRNPAERGRTNCILHRRDRRNKREGSVASARSSKKIAKRHSCELSPNRAQTGASSGRPACVDGNHVM